MKCVQGIPYLWVWILVLAFGSFLPGRVSAQSSDVLGEVQFEGMTNVEKTSGVWVDGQYVGYLNELKASKKVLLLPGEHTISVRQNGYQDFTQRVVLQPGQTQLVRVTMDKAATGPMPPDADLATIKINVNPSRAAVFVDGRFVGHVGEFGGLGRAMQVVPGSHHIRIALPGYATFQTDINPLPRQKVEVKTDLVKSEVPLAEPLLKGETNSTPRASEARAAAGPQR
ncbi:MAG: PEGA domain-containing protein [Terriglobales bacterium]